MPTCGERLCLRTLWGCLHVCVAVRQPTNTQLPAQSCAAHFGSGKVRHFGASKVRHICL